MACLLVIDDDYVFRATLQDMLEGAGYHVLEACDGREGLAALQAYPIDLVITDILILEQESFETLQQLRLLTPSPKIIALSGGGQTGRWEFLQVATGGGTNRRLAEADALPRPLRSRVGDPHGAVPPRHCPRDMSLRRFFPLCNERMVLSGVSLCRVSECRPCCPQPLFLCLSLHMRSHPRDGGGLTAFNVIVNTSGHGPGFCASNSYRSSVTRPSTITGLTSLRHFIKLLYQVSPTCLLLQMTRHSIMLSRVAAEVPNMPSEGGCRWQRMEPLTCGWIGSRTLLSLSVSMLPRLKRSGACLAP
jgi:CheY-like chemotaxis protein